MGFITALFYGVWSDLFNNTYTFQIQMQCRSYYTIHGLWPNYGFYCNSSSFNLTEIAPMRESLEEYWPSCFDHSNEWLWEHEWNKHGSCTNMSQLGYFSKGLELRQKYSNECNLSTCDLCFDMNFSEIPCENRLLSNM